LCGTGTENSVADMSNVHGTLRLPRRDAYSDDRARITATGVSRSAM